ncbi:MAG TPA: TIR domain-containing protein, partial [Caulobacteraceae bacterium]
MTDIFISYARSTAAQAQAVGEALRALGYGVWRDDELPAHRAYVEVIEERLAAAKVVVVIWSAEAVKSEWVQSEADTARTDRKLVQMTVDGAKLPRPFDRIQCADLIGWTGDTEAQGWKKVVASIAELVGGAAAPAATAAGETPAVAPRKLSVCVLPFANISDYPQQEYFSDGISEDIITDLSKVSALSVVARNTAFTFKGKALDVPQVARQLGVSHVLEGSVRKAGNRLRITAQLIDGAVGDHIWAERWDRDLTDIFALQDEISEAIVAALRLKLLPEEKKAIERRGTENVEAYNLYLMARQYDVTKNVGDARL